TDVLTFSVDKTQAFSQNDSGAPTSLGSFRFTAEVFANSSPDFSSAVLASSVRAPNGQTVALPPDLSERVFAYGAEFDTKSALDVQFSTIREDPLAQVR